MLKGILLSLPRVNIFYLLCDPVLCRRVKVLLISAVKAIMRHMDREESVHTQRQTS